MADHYTYTDVDGDRIAVFDADIPGKGKGVNVRTDANGCSVPAEDFEAGWSAGHTHARADEARISELEKQVADLAALVHGHGEDIGQAQAAIRGLGQTVTDPLKGHSPEAWFEFGKKLRRQAMGEEE